MGKKTRATSRAAKAGRTDKMVARAQVAALPWRGGEGGIEFLLASSRDTRRWIIPKGWPMRNRSASAAAAIEALEEAGLLGVIGVDPIGAYHYEKRLAAQYSLQITVSVFPLRVVRQRDTWPEMNQRVTRWFSREDAALAVAEAGLKEILLSFVPRRETPPPASPAA